MEDVEYGNLTADAARSALIQMIRDMYSGVEEDILVDQIQDAEAVWESEGKVRYGTWVCDLKEKKFTMQMASPVLYIKYKGVFQKEQNGWTAVVTTWVQK